jgi:hypothetical protein
MFAFNFGAAPAAALVNLSQTFMFTLPMLGARYGMAKSSAAMGKAIKDFTGFAAPEAGARFSAWAKGAKRAGIEFNSSDNLSGDEKQFINRFIHDGHVDVSMAHDIMGIGHDAPVPGFAEVRDVKQKAMRAIGFFFHRAEVFNRMVSGLTAYRLRREELEKQGLRGEELDRRAQDWAIEETYRTQADYASANRAVMWKSNTARILTTYKQYVLYVGYTLTRGFNESLKRMPDGLSATEQQEFKQARRIARREMAGIILAHGAVAGVFGMPSLAMGSALTAAGLAKRHKVAAAIIAGSIATLIPMLIGAFDDEDEPFDLQQEMRLWLADTLGTFPAEIITKGGARALRPLGLEGDLHNRVTINSLLYYDPEYADTADASALHGWLADTALGPAFGFTKQMANGVHSMMQGDLNRAASQITPVRLFRDMMKANRYASDDAVLNQRGEPVIDGIKLSEIFAQVMGFTPARLAEAYELRGNLKNAEQSVLTARRGVLNAMFEAVRDKDIEGRAAALARVKIYNQRNPDYPLGSDDIMRSIKARFASSEKKTLGVSLNANLNARLLERAQAYGI